MSSSEYVNVDDSDLIWMFDQLTRKERAKVFQVALKKSVVVLANKTTYLFKKKYNYSGPRKETVQRKNGKLKTKNRHIAKVTSKVKNDDVIAKVHIMEDHRAKWFENGTQDRVTKGNRNVGYYRLRKGGRKYVLRIGKPGKRGRLAPGHFFQHAQTVTRAEMIKNIDTNLGNAITRLVNKK